MTKEVSIMTKEEAIKLLVNATYSDEWQGNEDLTTANNMAIEALETLEEFEKAQIITGGRLNGRTYAYKCGLEDGKRKALEQKHCKDYISREEAIQQIQRYGIGCFNADDFSVEQCTRFVIGKLNELDSVESEEVEE
jgi:hypothetical protein